MTPVLVFVLAIISSVLATSACNLSGNMPAMDELSSSLAVTIGAAPCTSLNPTNPIQLTVSVRNNNPNQTVTLLKWNTSLDPQANVLGIFQTRDAECGTPVDSLVIKVSRKFPPTQDDLVEIPAGGVKEVKLTLPPMTLSAGRQYVISAKGRWQGIWAGGRDDVTTADLANMGCASFGAFESNEIVVSF
ncbi:hypothetical protein ACJ72_00553 [Emergomyces africanus]|uniref:Ubiquitin 3 binding protein But2 C-terminal domain-containing protein n=1 Tax=Emergomyces africanus TaxID=1955775 RepID=A0A1B7P7U9_9EURO|nr:hypothetical protein ACJ72_00553 [Emergomyces africanus]